MIGGGKGAAIWMGGNMKYGTSQECTTYGSPMLTTKEQFGIVDVEVWMITKHEY
jgi:hypothetical protein